MEANHLALVALGRKLRSLGYRFVTVTPSTQRIVLDRPEPPMSLQAVLGWNCPFSARDIDQDIIDWLENAGFLSPCNGGFRATVRFATIDDLLFAHSAFPTIEQDAVFFGPDTYRFVRWLRSSLADLAGKGAPRVVDVGCGSGAGGIYAAKLLGPNTEIILADINCKALEYSEVNAVINDLPCAGTALSDILEGIEGRPDVVLANPPYLVDEGKRLYRHGGGDLGLSVAIRIVEEALSRLMPGGRLVLYTGTPIIAGIDLFFERVRPLLQLQAQQFVYEEIDPDVFGEELHRPAYAQAERIAAVGLTVIK